MSNYWDRSAEEFYNIYREEKSYLKKVVQRVFRKGMRERFDLTIKECEDTHEKKILDIGCGPGLLSIELAKRGAYVVGLDLSSRMINIANSLAKKYDLTSKCKFLCDEFMRHNFNEDFDISIALGFFDYIEDPTLYLKKIKSLTKEKSILTFPSKFDFQTPARMIWLKKRKCQVFFYTRKEISRLLLHISSNFKVKNIGGGFFYVVYI